MTDNGQYDVNFFKAKTPHARVNRNLIITFASIWAIAVFGFQFLLMAFNEDTPEKAYTSFQSVWPAVIEQADTNIEAKKELSRSLLSVLGKTVTVSPAHQSILKETLSWNIYSMVPDSLKTLFTEEPTKQTFALAQESIGLASIGMDKLMVELLPYSLVKVESEQLNAATRAELPGIMKLYLVHNQSALTDFTFMGFPFHYWYTAQFLLILFVVLCVVYAILLERTNRKYNFIETS